MAAEDSDLVEEIYRAMHGSISWQDWLDGLRRRFDGVRFAMWGHDLQANSNLGMMQSGFDPDYMRQWVDYYSGVNAWSPGLAAARVGVVHTAEQLLGRAELMRTEYYHDWVRPQENIATGIGITLFSDSNRFFGLTANVRLKDEAQRNPELISMLARIAPHLSRAFDMSRRLSQAGSVEDMEKFVAQLPLAAIALNVEGRFCYANALAQRFITEWSEPAIASNGGISFADPEANILLERALRAIQFRTLQALPHRVPVKLGQYGASWRMSVVPAPMHPEGDTHFALDDHTRAVAFLFLEAGAGQVQQKLAQELAGRYGLSPAETELSLALYAGETLNQIATRKGLSVHTVRNQLRTAFSKTHAHRQHQLVRLISDLLAEERI